MPDIDTQLDELNAELGAVEDDDDDFDDERAEVPDMDRAMYETFLARRAATPYGQLLSRLRRLPPSEVARLPEQGYVWHPFTTPEGSFEGVTGRWVRTSTPDAP